MLSDTIQYPTTQQQQQPQYRYSDLPRPNQLFGTAFSPVNVHKSVVTPPLDPSHAERSQWMEPFPDRQQAHFYTDVPGVSWSFDPYPAMAGGGSTSTATDGSDATPSTAWNDTPRTLYKTSPGTEVGDWDVSDDDEDDAVVRSKYYPSTTTTTTPVWHAAATYTPASAGYDGRDARDQFKDFTMQLNESIRNATLFPASATDPISTALFPSSSTAAVAVSPHPHPLSISSNGPQITAPAISNDVISSTPPPQPQRLLRKPSLHLRQPARPIDPFQRPSPGAAAPLVIAPPPMVATIALRRPRSSGPTVSPRDLMLPTATFEFGTDPDALLMASVLELEDEQEVVMDLGFGAGANGDVGVENDVPARTEPAAAAAMARRTRTRTPAVKQEAEEPRPVALGRRKFESASDAEGDSDGEYEDRRSSGRLQRPYKRARQSISTTTPAPMPTIPTARRTTTTTTQQRSRHLQPNLVRNNACMHGCPLVFSTAYEARRHQEDAHGREEAYALLQAPSAPVYARDYRFLMQIGVQSGSTWDAKVKEAARRALAHLDACGEEQPLSGEMGGALVEFARGWSKRYQCPGCGLGFSRLDSKKRHFEKGCPNRGG